MSVCSSQATEQTVAKEIDSVIKSASQINIIDSGVKTIVAEEEPLDFGALCLFLKNLLIEKNNFTISFLQNEEKYL